MGWGEGVLILNIKWWPVFIESENSIVVPEDFIFKCKAHTHTHTHRQKKKKKNPERKNVFFQLVLDFKTIKETVQNLLHTYNTLGEGGWGGGGGAINVKGENNILKNRK